MTPAILVPLVSAFTDDTVAMSEIRVARTVRFHRDRGADGFVVGTEAGEVTSLSLSERKQLLEWVLRDAPGMPVYVNVTALTTSAAVDLCQHAQRHGARGAVFTAPPLGTFREPEIAGLVRAIRRHGNLLAAFLDPAGAWDGLRDEAATLGLSARGLDAVGWGAVASHSRPAPDEAVLDGAVVSPFGVLGADALRRIVAEWDAFGARVQGLFRHGGPARVGKAFFESCDLETGPPRGPMLPLDEPGRALLGAVLAQL